MIICKSCGVELEDGLLFCTECGAKQEQETTVEPISETAQASFCINCGAAIPEGSVFCTECGTPVGGTAPVGAAAPLPKTPKISMKQGIGKKLLMAVAGIAAVGVVCALGIQIVTAVSPHAAVTKGFVATTKQLQKSGKELSTNVELLSVIASNLPKANTQTVKLEFNLDNSMGYTATMLNNMSPVLKLESDVANKYIYADLSAMGFSFYGCAKDTLIGISAPMLYGEKVMAIDTKTIGADLKKLGITTEDILGYGATDISDLSTLSFCIFDKKDVTAEKIVNGILGNTTDYSRVKGEMKKLLTTAIADMEVDKEGKVTIDFADKSVKGTEYIVTVTPAVQRKLMEGMFDLMVSTEAFKKIAKEENITAIDIKEARADIADTAMREYKINVTIDNKGRLVALSTTIAEDLQNAVKLELSFNDYETLINDISCRVTATNGYSGLSSFSLTARGNHTGKDGEFDNETVLKITDDGDTVNLNWNTDYTVEKGKGELTSRLSMTLPYVGNVGVNLSGETTVSKSQKTAEINLTELNVEAGSAFKGKVGVSAKYNMTSGVSGKGNKFFTKGTTVLVLKATAVAPPAAPTAPTSSQGAPG